MKTDLSSAQLTPREAKLAERKNRVVDSLSTQFAKNAMSLEEYERLVDYIQKAESERELTIIEKIVGESAATAGMENESALPKGGLPFSREDFPAQNSIAGIFGSDWSDIAFMSSREVSGASIAGKQRSFLSFFGNTVITVEEGQLPPGKTFVNAVSLLGNTVITVPQGVRVTLEANAVLGNAVVHRSLTGNLPPPPNAPELVVTGGAFLGNLVVEIRTRRVDPRGIRQPPIL